MRYFAMTNLLLSLSIYIQPDAHEHIIGDSGGEAENLDEECPEAASNGPRAIVGARSARKTEAPRGYSLILTQLHAHPELADLGSQRSNEGSTSNRARHGVFQSSPRNIQVCLRSEVPRIGGYALAISRGVLAQ